MTGLIIRPPLFMHHVATRPALDVCSTMMLPSLTPTICFDPKRKLSRSCLEH